VILGEMLRIVRAGDEGSQFGLHGSIDDRRYKSQARLSQGGASLGAAIVRHRR
jgi:hypothetical protein